MSALGTEFKIKEDKILVKVDPMDGLHMSDYDFDIELHTHPNRSVILNKSNPLVIKADEDRYKVCITSEVSRKLGNGAVKLNFIAYIPDPDFPDGYRTSVVENICTGVDL